MTPLSLRLRMAWAVLRNRSVCFRMIIDGNSGISSKSDEAFIVNNFIINVHDGLVDIDAGTSVIGNTVIKR